MTGISSLFKLRHNNMEIRKNVFRKCSQKRQSRFFIPGLSFPFSRIIHLDQGRQSSVVEFQRLTLYLARLKRK